MSAVVCPALHGGCHLGVVTLQKNDVGAIEKVQKGQTLLRTGWTDFRQNRKLSTIIKPT